MKVCFYVGTTCNWFQNSLRLLGLPAGVKSVSGLSLWFSFEDFQMVKETLDCFEFWP